MAERKFFINCDVMLGGRMFQLRGASFETFLGWITDIASHIPALSMTTFPNSVGLEVTHFSMYEVKIGY